MKHRLMSPYFKQWEKCIQIELKFWSGWILAKGLEWKDDFEKRINPFLKADRIISDLINKNITVPRILDVGSGPLSSFPKFLIDGRRIDLVAIDALAADYNKLLEKINVKPLILTKKGLAEQLSSCFEAESFDFIYMRNTLDHTYDPFTVIDEMLVVLRKECYIFLSHRKNLGEREDYSGSALWNLKSENNQLIIWNKGRHVNLSYELHDYADIKIIDNDSWIDVVIKKNS